MILAPHILAGALVGSKASSPALAAIFGFLSHYVLDALPHFEYDIENLKDSQSRINKKFIIQILKVAIDFSVGFGLGLWLVWNTPARNLALSGMLGALIPDGLLFLAWRLPNQKFLKFMRRLHSSCHIGNHFGGRKKSPIWLGLTTEIIVFSLVLIGLTLL